MVDAQQMEATLRQSRADLEEAFGAATDPAMEAEIAEKIKNVDRKLRKILLLSLNEAAALVSDAADDLMGVVRSARTGPFDRPLQRIAQSVARMRVQIEEAVNQETGEAREAAKTEDPDVEPPLPAPNPSPAPPPDAVQPPPGIPDVIWRKKFSFSADVKAEYEAEWANCRIREVKRGEISGCVKNLNTGKAKYEQAAAQFQGMPWYFIGIIHGMETSFDFKLHLHNGDPLSARTLRVPRGRPLGDPPFTWEASARDAMVKEGFDQVTDWSQPHLLYLWEMYNGFGYRKKGLRTPYLWSYSNLYSKGRYIADGVFDENAPSKQCGAAVMLKALLE